MPDVVTAMRFRFFGSRPIAASIRPVLAEGIAKDLDEVLELAGFGVAVSAVQQQ